MTFPVVVVTPNDLRELVRDAVREALAGRREQDTGEWVDAAGAAAILGVHVRTVGNLAKRSELPSSRVGRLLRFRHADVTAYLERAHAARRP